MDARVFNNLLRKIKSDPNAFDRIFLEYAARIKLHLQRRFGGDVDEEDVTQSVFLKLLSLRQYEYVLYPASWLYRIADRCALDLLRKTQPAYELTEDAAADFDIDRTILKMEVKTALKRLDPESQKIIYLYYWEGYTFREIGLMLDLTHAAVRAKASRAYKLLSAHVTE